VPGLSAIGKALPLIQETWPLLAGLDLYTRPTPDSSTFIAKAVPMQKACFKQAFVSKTGWAQLHITAGARGAMRCLIWVDETSGVRDK
jgi:hypothetical protein